MFTVYSLEEIKDVLKHTLSEERYLHTIGVADSAKELAIRFGADPEKAYLAGLLHDCAKEIPKDKRIPICKKYGVMVSKLEERNTGLLHGKLGEVMAKKVYKVTDREILDAIRTHTVGMPGMSKLQEIVYLADFIEPGRKNIDCLEEIRAYAKEDLDKAVYYFSAYLVEFLERTKPGDIDALTYQTCHYYKERINQ